jgi:hypothetical protein
MGANAFAAPVNSARCPSSEDMFAVRTAIVQQSLMVAAFSCNAIKLYNKFVTTYQRDLQASDVALQMFFSRLNGQSGIANYHSFKTQLANTSSIQSGRDPRTYCANAQATFDAALAKKNSLKTFIAGQAIARDDAVSPCQLSTNNTLHR